MLTVLGPASPLQPHWSTPKPCRGAAAVFSSPSERGAAPGHGSRSLWEFANCPAEFWFLFWVWFFLSTGCLVRGPRLGSVSCPLTVRRDLLPAAHTSPQTAGQKVLRSHHGNQMASFSVVVALVLSHHMSKVGSKYCILLFGWERGLGAPAEGAALCLGICLAPARPESCTSGRTPEKEEEAKGQGWGRIEGERKMERRPFLFISLEFESDSASG